MPLAFGMALRRVPTYGLSIVTTDCEILSFSVFVANTFFNNGGSTFLPLNNTKKITAS